MSRIIQGIGQWRPGTSRRTTAVQLVGEFLHGVEGMNPDEAAEIAGVGVATILKWRRGAVSKLDPRVRRRMQFYLATLGSVRSQAMTRSIESIPHREASS